MDEKLVDVTLFKQIAGSLRFLCHSRSDINFRVGLVSKFMHNPKASHMVVAKHILKYLKGTTDYGLLFPKGVDDNATTFEPSLIWIGAVTR